MKIEEMELIYLLFIHVLWVLLQIAQQSEQKKSNKMLLFLDIHKMALHSVRPTFDAYVVQGAPTATSLSNKNFAKVGKTLS